MLHHRICTLALAVGLALVALPMVSAGGESVSIAISTPSVNFGLNIGAPPPLVAVPGLPVYQAPSVPDNYFVYQGYYYLYHGGIWYYSPHYNGPWMSLVMHQVPQPILAVPVPYYKKPPSHWKKHGPPPWAPAKGHEKDRGPHRYEAKEGPGGRNTLDVVTFQHDGSRHRQSSRIRDFPFLKRSAEVRSH